MNSISRSEMIKNGVFADQNGCNKENEGTLELILKKTDLWNDNH